MTDAAPAEDKGKTVAKATKSAAADGAVDNKKKFEVKKVSFIRPPSKNID